VSDTSITTIIEQENDILKEFHNSVGHSLLDYFFAMGLDRTSQMQSRHRAMEKIQIACNKCDLLLKEAKRIDGLKALFGEDWQQHDTSQPRKIEVEKK